MPRQPMPPIATTATDRWFLEYSTPFGRHTLLFRSQDNLGIDAATAALISYVNAVKDNLYTSVNFDKLRHANRLSVNSFPVGWTPMAGTGITSAMTRNASAYFASFTGRTSGGRYITYHQFGINPVLDDTFRLESGATAGYADVITLMNSVNWPFVGKDGFSGIYNNYVNIGVSAYYQRKYRRGA